MDRVAKSFYRILIRSAKVHDAIPALKGIMVVQVGSDDIVSSMNQQHIESFSPPMATC